MRRHKRRQSTVPQTSVLSDQSDVTFLERSPKTSLRQSAFAIPPDAKRGGGRTEGKKRVGCLAEGSRLDQGPELDLAGLQPRLHDGVGDGQQDQADEGQGAGSPSEANVRQQPLHHQRDDDAAGGAAGGA